MLSFPNEDGVNKWSQMRCRGKKNVIALQFVQQTPSFHQIQCGVGFWNMQCNESSTTKALPFIVVHVFDSTMQLYHLMRALSNLIQNCTLFMNWYRWRALRVCAVSEFEIELDLSLFRHINWRVVVIFWISYFGQAEYRKIEVLCLCRAWNGEKPLSKWFPTSIFKPIKGNRIRTDCPDLQNAICNFCFDVFIKFSLFLFHEMKIEYRIRCCTAFIDIELFSNTYSMNSGCTFFLSRRLIVHGRWRQQHQRTTIPSNVIDMFVDFIDESLCLCWMPTVHTFALYATLFYKLL